VHLAVAGGGDAAVEEALFSHATRARSRSSTAARSFALSQSCSMRRASIRRSSPGRHHHRSIDGDEKVNHLSLRNLDTERRSVSTSEASSSSSVSSPTPSSSMPNRSCQSWLLQDRPDDDDEQHPRHLRRRRRAQPADPSITTAVGDATLRRSRRASGSRTGVVARRHPTGARRSDPARRRIKRR